MKLIISCLFFLILIQSGCRQDTSSFPPQFTGYKNNPILMPGRPGSWDELFVSAPQVVFFENTFYLFYLGGNESGRMAVGLATSCDGFHFKKFEGNPLLAPDSTGFDAFTVGPGIILKEDTSWVMYYNCQELAGYSPGASVGRATAKQLTGPWIRSNIPIMTSGKKGEWDDGFILPCSVLKLEDGSYRLYYTGGREIASGNDFYIGMAVSQDGLIWKKYDDPSTTQYPFSESDPVFKTGEEGDWDEKYVWMANVSQFSDGFRMYYGGNNGNNEAIGYSTSRDGIHWERYPKNPIFQVGDDPFTRNLGAKGFIENPSLLFLGDTCFMYYDYDIEGKIGLASSHIN